MWIVFWMCAIVLGDTIAKDRKTWTKWCNIHSGHVQTYIHLTELLFDSLCHLVMCEAICAICNVYMCCTFLMLWLPKLTKSKWTHVCANEIKWDSRTLRISYNKVWDFMYAAVIRWFKDDDLREFMYILATYIYLIRVILVC